MIALKLARLVHDDKEDSWVDICGNYKTRGRVRWQEIEKTKALLISSEIRY